MYRVVSVDFANNESPQLYSRVNEFCDFVLNCFIVQSWDQMVSSISINSVKASLPLNGTIFSFPNSVVKYQQQIFVRSFTAGIYSYHILPTLLAGYLALPVSRLGCEGCVSSLSDMFA